MIFASESAGRAGVPWWLRSWTLRGAVVLCALALPGALHGQCSKDSDCKGERVCIKGVCQDPPQIDLEHVCALNRGELRDFTPGLANPEAMGMLKRIGDAVLLKELPEVRSGPIQLGAIATIMNKKRLIVFDPEFIRRARTAGGEWPVLFTLAHELGHHVNGDVLMGQSEDQHAREYSADLFATRVLHRLGASREQALAALDSLPPQVSQASASHPGVEERKRRVAAEYDAINRPSPAPRPTPPPAPTCPAGQTWNGASCVDRCAAGQRWDGSRCVSNCGAGKEWDGTACVSICSSDQKWDGSSCVDRCDECSYWDDDTRRCESLCEPNERCVDGECRSKRGRGNPDGGNSGGASSGTILQACGCWGYIWPGPRQDNRCASGLSEPLPCAGWCMGGGSPWAIVCQ